ncbi:hypothetical protein A3Q56_07372 [Intoshia linei]|uniref:Cleavage stimulation factor 50 kDa subunit n=1 Tax=Intoshia linei TaxID=1819745 RepID=A0A177AU76_9BILA|nr:hypothetical protein A3Q56_07372 [Intoshia linei]
MKDQHEDFINSMVYSSNGGQYLTTSQDGSFKIWDGRSNRCTSTVKRAHDGKPVTSAVYSKNDLYYLTSGIGGMVKLWDSRSIELPIIEYAGAQSIGVQNLPTNACFNHDEKYIVYCEAKTGTLCTWNARTSERLNLSSLTHTGIVNYLVHSPTFPAFVSCGEDHRAKFWINNL